MLRFRRVFESAAVALLVFTSQKIEFNPISNVSFRLVQNAAYGTPISGLVFPQKCEIVK